jgi:3-phosphoshikimate 1-carboxyvinyltransferase
MAENGCAADRGGLPLTLSGSLRAGEYTLPGNVSSQFITGLLLALSATKGGSRIRLTGALESPEYVKMTISTLRKFGAVIAETPDGYDISGGALVSPGTYEVEGDWSGAAFFIAMTALGGRVAVIGLSDDSSQPDRAVARFASGLPDVIDVSGFPDIFPVLSVMACGKTGVTRLTGAARLRIKESDRIEACYRLITGLGGSCVQEPDALVVYGTGRLRGGAADSFNDHRIAMSAAVAAAICDESVTVTGAQAAKKSYGKFWDELDELTIFH